MEQAAFAFLYAEEVLFGHFCRGEKGAALCAWKPWQGVDAVPLAAFLFCPVPTAGIRKEVRKMEMEEKKTN